MCRATIVIASAALLAPLARADFMKVDLQFSIDSGATWSDSVESPAGPVQARLLVSAARTAGMVSIGGVSIRQIDLSNAAPGDFLDDLVLPPPVDTLNWLISVQGDRIDRVFGPSNNDITLAQLAVSSGGSAANPWVAASFTFHPADVGPRTIDFSALTSNLRLATVYTSLDGASSLINTNLSFDGGRITIVPTPATLAALALLARPRARRA